jgi:hypothetical protein
MVGAIVAGEYAIVARKTNARVGGIFCKVRVSTVV